MASAIVLNALLLSPQTHHFQNHNFCTRRTPTYWAGHNYRSNGIPKCVFSSTSRQQQPLRQTTRNQYDNPPSPSPAKFSLFDEIMEETSGTTATTETPVMFTNEDPSQSFDVDRWNLHRSSTRYTRLLPGMLFGITTRRILPTVSFLVVWSILIDIYDCLLQSQYGLPEVELPLTPFDLTAPVLGLLLVFRSNTAFDRFNAGSEATWEITSIMSSIAREILTFSACRTKFGRKERQSAYDLAQGCVAVHSWLMERYLKGRSDMSVAQRDSYNRLVLGDDIGKAVEWDQRTTTTPAELLGTLSLGLTRRLPTLDTQETTLLQDQISGVVSQISNCERLSRTPIPLGYTRYSVRFLWIWLSLLPFALVNTFATFGTDTWWEDKPYKPVMVFAMLFIGFIFLSIEDISVQIEEPFSILPLECHRKWLERDFGLMWDMHLALDEADEKNEKGKIEIDEYTSRTIINGDVGTDNDTITGKNVNGNKSGDWR